MWPEMFLLLPGNTFRGRTIDKCVPRSVVTFLGPFWDSSSSSDTSIDSKLPKVLDMIRLSTLWGRARAKTWFR